MRVIPPRGWTVPWRRKLTDEQVAEIRASKRTYKQLARQYGVVDATIWRIKKGVGRFTP